MLALIFLSATNGLHHFSILNGLQGGIVNNKIKIDKPFIKIDVKDYLLDHLTGDFYRYYDKKWNPFINTGLHCRKAAEEDEFGIYVSVNP